MSKQHTSLYVQNLSTRRKWRLTLFCIFLTLEIGILMSSCHVSASSIDAEVNVNCTLQTAAHCSIDKGSLNVADTIVKPGCNGDICLKEECIESAANILRNMDMNVNPCDNFYKFACGRFEKDTVVPDDEAQVISFGIVEEKLHNKLRFILEEEINSTDLKPFKIAKNVYKSCTNERAIESHRLEPLKKIIKELGGWPVLESDHWKGEEFSWTRFTHNCRKLGYFCDYLIRLDVTADPKDRTKNIIDLNQPRFRVVHEYVQKGFNETAVKAYYKYMVDVAVLMGVARKNAEQDLQDSVKFEIKLAKIALRREERRNSSTQYNPMSLTELKGNYSSIPWLEFLKAMLPSDVVLRDDEIVIVRVPSYLAQLEELLKATPNRVVANYLMWAIVTISAPYLNSEIRKLQQDFHAVLYGVTEPPLKWKFCIYIVSSQLPVSVGAMYIRKYFSEEAKHHIVNMVKNIKNEFIEILNKTEWMDEITKKRAMKKAAAINDYIAYPNELLNDSKIEKYYEKLEFSDESYLSAILKVFRFQKDNSLSKLRKPVEKNNWARHASAAVIDSTYTHSDNSIEFPASILQGTFFDNGRPRYMNYGAIGSIISHEITHGFDDRGRQYDKDGNLLDWWDETTAKKFLERAQCIIDQYGNYTVKEVGLNLNGRLTQGENIADNGGAKAAYMAYNNWVAKNGKEQKLPGLPYTPNQVYWISMANVWCTKMKPEALRFIVATNQHPPGEFRVIGTVSNSEAFAKDFNCPVGSNMNPIKKCVVW